MSIDADHKCINCHRDFADHDYVVGSIVTYRCPVKSQESVYGYFHGGDPRNFHPDGEDCTPEELANHKRACEYADANPDFANLENPSGWFMLDGVSVHVLNAPFGIGVQTWEEEMFFEPASDVLTEDE